MTICRHHLNFVRLVVLIAVNNSAYISTDEPVFRNILGYYHNVQFFDNPCGLINHLKSSISWTDAGTQ